MLSKSINNPDDFSKWQNILGVNELLDFWYQWKLVKVQGADKCSVFNVGSGAAEQNNHGVLLQRSGEKAA